MHRTQYIFASASRIFSAVHVASHFNMPSTVLSLVSLESEGGAFFLYLVEEHLHSRLVFLFEVPHPECLLRVLGEEAEAEGHRVAGLGLRLRLRLLPANGVLRRGQRVGGDAAGRVQVVAVARAGVDVLQAQEQRGAPGIQDNAQQWNWQMIVPFHLTPNLAAASCSSVLAGAEEGTVTFTSLGPTWLKAINYISLLRNLLVYLQEPIL